MIRSVDRPYPPGMREIDPIIDAWREQDARVARVLRFPWGELVVDPRFPRIINANAAKVVARGPVDPAAALADTTAALPHARRLAVTVCFPDDQPDLIVALSAEGGDLFFDDVYVAGPTPEMRGDVEGRVEEVEEHDAAFWGAFHATGALFGILPETLAELEVVERDLLIPAGKRWFVARGASGAIEAMAALIPGPSAEIDHVITLPAARRQGFATALTARCVAEARAAGTHQVHLLAQPGGDGERIYRRLGFRRIGAFAGWLSAPRD
jgi:ribosomal protein S18 acetylase RimI-like enzyme